MLYRFLFGVCMIIQYIYCERIRTGSISTAISSKLPTPLLHDIVIFESIDMSEKIALDFTPVPSKSNGMKLLLGRDISGMIRLRYIPFYIDIGDRKSILDYWKENDDSEIRVPYVESPFLSKLISSAFLLDDFVKNEYRFNLYKRNCRHFRGEVQKLYKKLSI